MQIELNTEELGVIMSWFDVTAELAGTHEADEVLAEKLNVIRDEMKELEAMDFDDCAGGACKL